MKTNTTKLPSFRLVVRGELQKGKKTIRVRRVKHVRAADYSAAAEAFAKQGPSIAKGLRKVYTNIFPPL